MKKVITLIVSSFLLVGCGSGYNTGVQKSSEKLVTIGDASYTKEDLYTMLKKSVGSATAINQLQNLIYDAEIPVTDEIKQKAQDEYNAMAESTENINELLEENGYTEESYIETVVIPNLQSDMLLDKYFTDNKKEIKKEYKASVAIILQCEDEASAKKALEELKNGAEQKEVFEKYQSETASFSDDEVLISTMSSNVPTRLINTLYKQKETGLIEEVFTSEGEDSTAAYVAILVNNNYDDITFKLKEASSTDTDFATKCVQYYLKKHNFKIHDQDIFDK